jgi:predicted nucleic acid-binding protein
MDEIGWQELATTVVTIMEIQIGIERARRADVAIAETVQKWLTGLLQAGQPHVLPLDTDAAVLLGRMSETPALTRQWWLPETAAIVYSSTGTFRYLGCTIRFRTNGTSSHSRCPAGVRGWC